MTIALLAFELLAVFVPPPSLYSSSFVGAESGIADLARTKLTASKSLRSSLHLDAALLVSVSAGVIETSQFSQFLLPKEVPMSSLTFRKMILSYIVDC